MTAIENIRNGLIDDLLTITDKKSLLELQKIVKLNYSPKTEIKLTSEQIEMLQMSEDDIKNGRLITNDELNKRDLAWLNGL